MRSLLVSWGFGLVRGSGVGIAGAGPRFRRGFFRGHGVGIAEIEKAYSAN